MLNIFQCVYVFGVSSLVKCLFKSSIFYFFGFLFLSSDNSLYILDTRPFSDSL